MKQARQPTRRTALAAQTASKRGRFRALVIGSLALAVGPFQPERAVYSLGATPLETERNAVVDGRGRLFRSDDSGRSWATK